MDRQLQQDAALMWTGTGTGRDPVDSGHEMVTGPREKMFFRRRQAAAVERTKGVGGGGNRSGWTLAKY